MLTHRLTHSLTVSLSVSVSLSFFYSPGLTMSLTLSQSHFFENIDTSIWTKSIIWLKLANSNQALLWSQH